jgi:uncharacterized damage-inducible protein DinB
LPTEDVELRKHLVELLRGGGAHADPDTSLKDFPLDKATTKPAGSPHSVWQLLEHLRIALHDLLDYSTNSHYVELKWPEDYWPSSEQPPSAEEWNKSIQAFKADLKEFEDLVNDEASNLYAEIPWGKGQTLLRETLLAADHNSYHLGQIVLLRKQLGEWPE